MADSSNNAILSRRTLMSAAPAVALAALAIPTTAMAADDKSAEALQQHLAVLGKAIHDGRIQVKWSKSKTGKINGSKFTILLDGIEGAQFMGSILAGTVFAGLCTADDIIGRLGWKS